MAATLPAVVLMTTALLTNAIEREDPLPELIISSPKEVIRGRIVEFPEETLKEAVRDAYGRACFRVSCGEVFALELTVTKYSSGHMFGFDKKSTLDLTVRVKRKDRTIEWAESCSARAKMSFTYATIRNQQAVLACLSQLEANLEKSFGSRLQD